MTYTGAGSLKDAAVRAGYDKCTGCGVCTLTCPVWNQTRDIMLTAGGRIRVLQAGGAPGDMKESLLACGLCGACASACPVGVDTVALTAELRMHLVGKPGREPEGGTTEGGPSAAPAAAKLFFPGSALRRDEAVMYRAAHALEREGFALFDDAAISGIGADIEAGLRPGRELAESFIASMRGVKQIIAADGFLHGYLRQWLPRVRVTGLGEALLRLPGIIKAVNPADLYIIDSRGYHADYGRMVKFYDRMRRETGCMLNTSLQRAVIPTGAAGRRNRTEPGRIDMAAQAGWILQNRRPERVVAEDMEDLLVFKNIPGLKAIHVAELDPVGIR